MHFRSETLAEGVTIYCADCLDVLPELSALDAVVTDPPYGLSFMGKRWDYDVPSQAIWEACLTAMKPGAHLLAFAGTRTQHRMAVRIEDAGFDIRDMIAWVYGSGFPKSHNLDGDNKGWGTALKPAQEPITVARKPLIGTVADNVLAHGTGALNIDGCRVGNDSTRRPVGKPLNGGAYGTDRNERDTLALLGGSDAGRWPANLIHDGSEDVTGLFPNTTTGKPTAGNKPTTGQVYGSYAKRSTTGGGDSGSAARFFYCAKASKADRENGNMHPTVKPTALMRYLCRLVTPPGGVILDPFMGSGSTGKAAVLEGFGFIGIERDETYFDIARRRIEAALKQREKLGKPEPSAPDLFADLSP